MIQPTTSAEFRGTERFRVVRRIGSGGMGVVYEAFDRQRDARVALKFLPDADATALSRFKQEFRVLADVSHPHLIQLYELFSDQDQWFFTMELIEGLDFLTYVRGAKIGGHASATQRSQPTQTESRQGCSQLASEQTVVYEEGTDSPKRADLSERQIECLRAALRQLVEAVERLHALGILHRDLKPTNVLIAENGRVVVLDFGLAAELHDPRDDAAIGSGVSDVAGTVAYMSPEQVRGRALTPASDWYNVGVMLYEVLAGRRPFSGHSQQIMLAKTAFDPPEPKSLVPSVPDDLNELCMDLLCRAPQNRADGNRILAVCGAAASQTAAPSALGLLTRHEFVGRQKELKELSIAFARVRDGRSSVVLIEGESGVGKSALVHQFLDEQAREGQLVLTGRCYEQESVPFKAFDALIDALTRHLASLPTPDTAALLPRDILALAKIFPVLAQVPAVAAAPARRAEVPDQRELRRRAFAALRELLARIGDRRPLVLVIDDLQWGDVDSANLLNELLEPPDPPPFLFIGAYRREDVGRSACLQILRQTVASGENVARTTLSLAPLNRDECIELATCLLESEDPVVQSRAEEIVKESQGSPYFVCELAQHVREGIHVGAAAETCAAGIRLEDALWQRIQRLPSAERAVLEVLSIAARPLPPVDAFAAAGTDEPLGLLARLRSDRLIRVALTGGDEFLAPYHDRLRETIRSRLPASAAAQRHRALATVLERAKEPDPQLLAVHFEGAGELEVAGGYYALAADAANVSLAFDRAAQLYRKSLELKPLAADDRAAMLCKLADALANAGRGAEAGRQYLAAAAAAPSWQALMLRGKAGFQFCAAGDIDAGRESLAGVLRGLGLSLPATHHRALLSLLLNRCRLRLRGIRFRERREPDVPATLLSRVDVTWSVAVGLTMIDTIRGADFQTRNLLLALRTGEPYRIARALAWEATHVAMGGVTGRRRARQMLDAAGQIAERLGHPHARGMTMMGRGVSAYFLGDWREAQETCDRAVRAFNEDCTGASWELDTSQAFAYWSLFWLGRFAEIQSRYARLVSEARERGDRLAVANFTTFGGPFVFLSQDDPAGAEAALDGVMGAWSRQDFHVQHFTTLSARTYVELYRQNACGAWQNLLAEWPRLRASFLLNVECVRVYMRHLRASCALAAAADPRTPRSRVPELEREAQRDARRLERERPRYARPLAMMIRAALAARAGQRGQASDLLAGAIPLLDNHQLGIYSAAARFRRGQLLGGDFGGGLLEQATESMRQEKVINPERIVALFAPGRDER